MAGERGAQGSESKTGAAAGCAERTADTGCGVFFIMGHGREPDWPDGVQQHLCEIGEEHAFPTDGAAANKRRADASAIQRRMILILRESLSGIGFPEGEIWRMGVSNRAIKPVSPAKK